MGELNRKDVNKEVLMDYLSTATFEDYTEIA